jgi:hypothetical protein
MSVYLRHSAGQIVMMLILRRRVGDFGRIFYHPSCINYLAGSASAVVPAQFFAFKRAIPPIARSPLSYNECGPIIRVTDTQGRLTVFLIPVERWSDGAAAP